MSENTAFSQVLIDTVDGSNLTDAYNAQTLSSGSLTAWNDLIGSNNATVSAARAISTGFDDSGNPTVGSSSVFNGGQYVSFGTDAALATSNLFSGSSARSIAVVFNTPLGNNGNVNAIVGESGAANDGSWFELQARSNGAANVPNGGDPYLAGFQEDDGTDAAPATNQLIFAIVTYTGTTETVYWANGLSGSVNTPAVTNLSGALNTLSNPFLFGSDEGNELENGNMQLGQVLVYNNAMSGAQADAEIADLQTFYESDLPEPSTWTLLFVGLGACVFFTRRLSPQR